MALPLTETDKFLLLSAVGAPETRDRIAALLDLAGTGNMTGPASATDNALVRFDGSTGALVQNSGVIVSDANAITGVASLNGISAATIAFLDATSSIQTQINTKAPSASPTLTGTVTVSGIFNATGSTGHSIVGNQTNALIIKSLTGNSNGLRLYADTATDVASVVNGFNAALEFGANNTVYGSIAAAGAWTIGASGSTATHTVQGDELEFSTGAGGNFLVDMGNNDGSCQLTGGSNGSNSSSIFLYGGSHATQAQDIELRSAAQTVFAYDHSDLRLEASVPIYCVTSSGPQINLSDGGTFGTNADPHLIFTDSAATGGVIGFDNDVSNNMVVDNKRVTGALNLKHNGTTRISINTTGLGFFAATPVAQPAAYTPTNVTPDRSYDANATTVDELADVLGTLIADLQAYGLLQ
jgi:hypothetical protein